MFSKLMQRGKVNPSLRILSKNGPKGTLQLNEDTREALKKLHPKAEEACQETKLQEDPKQLASYIFDTIDEKTI